MCPQMARIWAPTSGSGNSPAQPGLYGIHAQSSCVVYLIYRAEQECSVSFSGRRCHSCLLLLLASWCTLDGLMWVCNNRAQAVHALVKDERRLREEREAFRSKRAQFSGFSRGDMLSGQGSAAIASSSLRRSVRSSFASAACPAFALPHAWALCLATVHLLG